MTALLLALALLTPAKAPVAGIATWFDATRNSAWYVRPPYSLTFYVAAGPALREQWGHTYRQRYQLVVTSPVTGRSALVWVVDWCSCNGTKRRGDEKIADLSPALFVYLCNCGLGRGIQRVVFSEPFEAAEYRRGYR